MRSSALFTLVVLSLLTLSFGPAPACEPTVACFDVNLSPATLTGDIYVDGNLIVNGVNNAHLSLTPDVPHLIEFRAIQLPGEMGLGDQFIYPDQGRTQSG